MDYLLLELTLDKYYATIWKYNQHCKDEEDISEMQQELKDG